ncbi:MAG TPA: hypothetical protein VN228_04145 [Pyrinomonadaceae bacterium]|nr:hypothetical protein [Pyrinomonadaceae bacterium]
MLPPNAVSGKRRGRGAAAAGRAALCALWLCGLALAAQAKGAADADASQALREKDVRRAEQVLAKLRLLDDAGAARPDAAGFRSHTRKLYPGLFVTVADLRPSDLKTDLDTAVFLYAEVGRAWPAAAEAAADCEGERRDIYLPLCRGLRGGTSLELLLSKARLHAAWAGAAVRAYRGAGDAASAGALAEMKAARANDLLIAARVVEELRPLEAAVELPTSLADYQERRALSKVSPERLDAQLAEALARAGALLRWMPRSPAFYSLRGAWRSYGDGLFWFRKVRRSQSMVVSADDFGPDPLRDFGRDPEQVGYAVSVNWRAAIKYTRLAEQSLSAAR